MSADSRQCTRCNVIGTSQSSLCKEPDDLEAIMQIETPFHAEHQLDHVAGQFAHGRQTRTQPRERISETLWDQAVALTPALSPSRVAKR